MMEKNLPEGWELTSLDEVTLKVEKVIPEQNPEELFEYIDIASINNEINRITDPKSLLGSDAPSRARQLVYCNDTLFSTVRTYLKNIAFVEKGFDGSVASTGFAVLRPSEVIIGKFIFYYTLTDEFLEPLNALQRGISYPAVKNSIVFEQEIPLPPLAEQKRIVAKLDAAFGLLDRMKERLARIPELLKNFCQAVLTQAVTGKLTEDIKTSDWEELTIGDLVSKIQAGKNFTCPSIPVTHYTVGLVKISAVTWGKFNPEETKTVIDQDMINPNLFIKEGDFLFSRANTLELVGASLIVDKIEYNIMLSDKIWRVVFKNQTTKRYLDLFLKSTIGRNEIESRASGNQLSMRNISQDKFKNIPVPLPPLAEQQEIVHRVEALLAKAEAIEAQYLALKAKIDRLPQALLAQAFRGELVAQDPTDEPAGVLLQKIKVGKGKQGVLFSS